MRFRKDIVYTLALTQTKILITQPRMTIICIYTLVITILDRRSRIVRLAQIYLLLLLLKKLTVARYYIVILLRHKRTKTTIRRAVAKNSRPPYSVINIISLLIFNVFTPFPIKRYIVRQKPQPGQSYYKDSSLVLNALTGVIRTYKSCVSQECNSQSNSRSRIQFWQQQFKCRKLKLNANNSCHLFKFKFPLLSRTTEAFL